MTLKATVDRAALADAMTWTVLAVPKRPSFPALAGVKITATKAKGGGTITLEAFDFETGHRAELPGKVSGAGTVLVPGFLVASLVSELRGDSVDLSVEDKVMILKAGRSTYRLNTLNLDESPVFPDVTTEDDAPTVEAEELRRILGLVAFAAEDNGPNRRLNGVRLQAGDGRLTALGMRSTAIAAAWTDYPLDFAAHLPIGSLEAGLKGLRGPVALGGDEGSLVLRAEARAVVLRLYAPDPFDWSTFLRGDTTTDVTFDAVELREAVRRAGLTCPENEGLRLMTGDAEVTITSGAADVAEGLEIVDVELEGEPLEILFGADVLGQSLTALPEGPVTMRAGGSSQRVQISDKTDSWTLVIMPRRK